MSESYRKSGVNIDAGNEFVRRIGPIVKKTRQRGVMSDLRGFAAYFALDLSDCKEPVIVSGTDGVGTKLKIAIAMKRLGTIGIDLVAMCVNDIACCGAKPLFFLDYFATPRLDPDRHTAIIQGIADGCAQAKCALIGGETAEMPGIYHGEDFDLAGFAVGMVDKSKIIDGSDIAAGNAIIGLASSGIHSNGYSLVNRVVEESKLDLEKIYDGMDAPLGEVLLTPTFIYSPLIENLSRQFPIKGIAHITGGGFWDNIPRILPRGVQAVIRKDSWKVPAIFRFMQSNARMDEEELFRVFNCGIGMTLVVPADRADEIMHAVIASGSSAAIIGETVIRPKGGCEIIVE